MAPSALHPKDICICPPVTSWIAGLPPLLYKEDALRTVAHAFSGRGQMGSGDPGNRPEAGTMPNVAAERTGIAALIRGPKDFWTGVIYVLFGGAAFWIARDYGFGTASRMGPGYFPTVLGALLMLIGAISLVRSFIVPGEPLGKFAIKAGALVLLATILFGFLINRAGLIIALLA